MSYCCPQGSPPRFILTPCMLNFPGALILSGSGRHKNLDILNQITHMLQISLKYPLENEVIFSSENEMCILNNLGEE